MQDSLTRRVYAVIDNGRGKTEAIRECISLMEQAITIVCGGVAPEVLKIASKMDLTNNLGLTAWADLVNRATERPVNVLVGSHRTMTWLCQRFATPDDTDYATLTVSVYWEKGEHVSVRLDGTPAGMHLCRINVKWRSADDQYREVPSEPLTLERAIIGAHPYFS